MQKEANGKSADEEIQAFRRPAWRVDCHIQRIQCKNWQTAYPPSKKVSRSTKRSSRSKILAFASACSSLVILASPNKSVLPYRGGANRPLDVTSSPDPA
jgi:hypothetical protein